MNLFKSYMKLMLTIICLLLLGCDAKKNRNQTDTIAQEDHQITKAEINSTSEGHQLLINGNPFYIKGAGLGRSGNISKLAKHGGNSFRTWSTNNAKELLDEAEKYGLYVTMGLNVARERHGFDYNNEEEIKKQYDEIKAKVMAFKDHPSIIIWAIGNELNLHATNPKVWNAVNELSKMIHEIDPNHLTTTTLAGINPQLIQDIKERAPDIDLLSIQMYGDIVNLPKYIQETGWQGPYIITEWGATGHWEVPLTSWEAPIENNSTVKANFYLQRYQSAIAPYQNQCLGAYVFLWGQKQERTPTWYGVFMENGNETQAVDVMHYIWNNKWPDNRTPILRDFSLDGKGALGNVTLEAGKKYKAKVSIEDIENDTINYRWDIKPESTDLGEGGDFETTPESLTGLIQGSEDEIQMTAPASSGAYRLFIYADDGKGHTAHANIPFFVND